MSFILDALKKSENERARQNGPALLEARVVPPRRGPPAWAIVVGIVLAANLALLGYVLIRARPPAAEDGTARTAVTAPPLASLPPANTAPAQAPAASPPVMTPAPATAQQESLPPPAAEVVNPADYAPARAPGTLARPAPQAGAGATMDSSLPTAADLTARATGLPALRLTLHVYDEQPQNRYVLVNAQRVREGETTNDGVRVERITPEGVLMSWRGQRFRLLPGE